MRFVMPLILMGCATGGAVMPGRDWSCWQRAAQEPSLPQGDVLFIRERLSGDSLEMQSVHEQNGQRGATRLAFHRVDDRFESTVEDVNIVVRGDSEKRTLHYASPGLELIEVTRFEDGQRTVTTIDQSPGGPQSSTVRFVPADCAVVERELARLP